MTDEVLEVLSRRCEPLRLVIYDCDGVLIDSEHIADRLVSEELTALGWPVSPAECGRLFLGISYEDMCPAIAVRLGCPLPDGWLESLLARVIATMEHEAEPIPGARAALEAMAVLGLDWRIASNSSHEEMTVKFQRAGFTDLVASRLYSAHDVIVRGGQAKAAGMTCLALSRHDDGVTARAHGAIPFADMHALPKFVRHAMDCVPC